MSSFGRLGWFCLTNSGSVYININDISLIEWLYTINKFQSAMWSSLKELS